MKPLDVRHQEGKPQMGASRSGLISGGILFLCTVTALGCNQDSDLELLDTNSSALLSADPPIRSAFAVTHNSPGASVVAVLLDGATIRYGSVDTGGADEVGGRSQDTLVFVEDPNEEWNNGFALELPPPGAAPGIGVSWFADCASGTCANRSYNSRVLASTDFGQKSGDTAQAVFSYDRGACSNRVEVGPLLQQIVTQATALIEMQAAAALPDLINSQGGAFFSAQAQSAVFLDGLAGPNVAAGGFQLDLNLSVAIDGFLPESLLVALFVIVDQGADVNGRYQWLLNDGVIGVHPLATSVLSQYNYISVDGVAKSPTSLAPQLTSALLNDLPAAVTTQALTLQERTIPAHQDGSGDSVCVSVANCADSASAQLLTDGLGLAALKGLITNSEKTELSAVVHDPKQWTCTDRSTEDATQVCKMLVRGKRLNVYPDAIELVIREAGSFPIARESALEVALRAAGDATTICNAPSAGQLLSSAFQNAQDSGSTPGSN